MYELEGVTVRIVPDAEWTHGEVKGTCELLSLVDVQPLVEVRGRENDAESETLRFQAV